MAVASEQKLQQCLNDNINWDLLKPCVKETKLFSQGELRRKRKQRLEDLMKKISDSDNRKLFVQALEKTSHDAGHQKILEVLQADVDTAGKYFVQQISSVVWPYTLLLHANN